MRQLEHQFADELVVIGVHSGKFTAERVTANIRQAVLRLGVEHPVVNDRLFRIWRSYTVNAWPTVVLIGPTGHVLDVHPGEIHADTYRPIVAQVVAEAEQQGVLSRRPLRFPLEAAAEPRRPLAFPGKVLADGERLFIADSGHHRLAIVSFLEDRNRATVEAVIGRGTPGMEDGSFDEATFNRPHGMALEGAVLYVADTGNHAIRAVDLPRREVTTLAGTGEPAHRAHAVGFAPRMPLSSPWDLAIAGDGLYIAMAGTHQIWRLDLGTSDLLPYAGSGAEALVDGPGMVAALAQPSGLSPADDRLYFADSESSAIRAVALSPGPKVSTLIGTGLFDFGDRDGVGDEARLQHAQGLAWSDGLLYVADTYNNKIKAVDPGRRRAQTFLGTGEPGLRDGTEPLFYEPGGVAVGGGRLYIADTNNHAIRIVDLATKQTLTLEITGGGDLAI